MRFTPIGVVRVDTQYEGDPPVQTAFARGRRGRAVIFPEYEAGLQDLESVSHIYLICHLNRASGWKPLVSPHFHSRRRGLFATRSPNRPNPIGLSLVDVEKREGCTLFLDCLDLLDGTPILDIKPCTASDCVVALRNLSRVEMGSGIQKQPIDGGPGGD